MPIFNHLGTRGEMAEGLKTQLSWVGRPFRKSLCLSFYYQIVLAIPYGPTDVSAKRNLRPGELVLSVVIKINPRNIQWYGRLPVIHVGLYAEAIALPCEIEIVVRN